MRIAAVALGSLLSLGLLGCSSGANKKLDEYADKMCACKDAACGEKVMKEMTEWAEKNSDAKGDEKEATKSAERMMACMTKLGPAGAAGDEKKEAGGEKK